MSCLPELQKLIQEKYGLEAAQLDPTTSIREKGLDSLALVELLFAIEDHFGISLPDDQSHLDTLDELAVLVDKLCAAKQAKSAEPTA